MKVTTHASAANFLESAGDWLEREESLNNMILGLAGRLAKAERPSDPPAVMTSSAASLPQPSASTRIPSLAPPIVCSGRSGVAVSARTTW